MNKNSENLAYLVYGLLVVGLIMLERILDAQFIRQIPWAKYLMITLTFSFLGCSVVFAVIGEKVRTKRYFAVLQFALFAFFWLWTFWSFRVATMSGGMLWSIFILGNGLLFGGLFLYFSDTKIDKLNYVAYGLIYLFLMFWSALTSTNVIYSMGAGLRMATILAGTGALITGIILMLKDKSIYNRGPNAFVLAALLYLFYISLYYNKVFDQLVQLVWQNGNRWYFYGFLYTVAVTVGGLVFIAKNRRSKYQVVRTSVVIFTQVVIAFSIPVLMKILMGYDYYFSYLWPLKIEYFYPKNIMHYPLPIVLYSFVGSMVMVPLLAFFFGKRWYCSWICGCGGLANTFGDPWRHLSSKTRKSWKFETISVHAVLIFAMATTALVVINWMVGPKNPTFAKFAFKVQEAYGFFIMVALSGMAGVFLYPLLGTRVWCRFFCPMAAMLGLIQKFGRYRITVNGKLCMACGNCSKYCEMGIDVRQYAMKSEDFKRASCVGCGMCAHVCPRGVLKLENRPASEEPLI